MDAESILMFQLLQATSDEIRCTSVPGYNLPGGVDTEEHLRKEILATPVFIGLISEAGLSSAYVLFELGARWGANKPMIPLLAPGISPDTLDGPISNLNALSCASSVHLHQLVSQIAQELSITAELPAVYQDDLEIATIYPPVPHAVNITEQKVPQEAVDKIAELRSEAISTILNRPVRSDAELAALVLEANNWWKSVKAVLEAHFTKAEVLNFTRLGSVPDVVFPNNYNPQHAKIRREFALQERRLLDIIARHTR